MKRALGIFFLILAVGVAVPNAMAWNRIGHMVVAGIAYDELTPAEQTKLAEILSHLHNNDHLASGLGSSATDPRDLVMAAACWPDLIKTDTTRYYNNGYDENAPLQLIKESEGQQNGKPPMHKGWHFIDKPYDLTGNGHPPAMKNNVNIVEVLTVLDRQLRQPNNDSAERAYELVWILHLVGDIHQPLHCAEGFDEQNPKGDVGGNNIVTIDTITHEKELHAFWDDLLGKDTLTKKKRLRLDLDVVKASDMISSIGKPTLPSDAVAVDFQKWAEGTHSLAEETAYGAVEIDVVQTHDGEKAVDSVTIDDDYRSIASRIAHKQVYLAGRRLAVLLKAYLQK